MRERLRQLALLVPVAPALAQLGILAYAVARRLPYPYDLEWMEGGMLTHAARLAEGQPLYAPPSVDFIPQLYTPLYPATVAALSKVFGLSYQLGRAVSVAALAAVLILLAFAVVSEAPRAARTTRAAAWAGAAAALGFFASAYPWVDCFYDLVRVDSFALAIGLAGLVVLRVYAPRPGGGPARLWHPGVAAAGVLLGMSFFAKQTGFLLVASGGAALVVMNWRAVPIYVLAAGAMGGGGAALLNAESHGWFWTYVYRVHQFHDWRLSRFWDAVEAILGHYPVLTAVIALGLCAVAAHAALRRRLPAGAAGFLYWTWLFACGAVIGGVGYGTMWAVKNAYIPAVAFGAAAAGSALTVLAECAGALPLRRPAWAHAGAAVAVGAALGLQLWAELWTARTLPPSTCATAACAARRHAVAACWAKKSCVLLPSAEDRAAGDKLIARLRAVDGDVFMPSHPWYPRLAGKRALYVHRIGIKDVTWTPSPIDQGIYSIRTPQGTVTFHLWSPKKPLPPEAQHVRGLAEALRERRFAAVVLDDGEPPGDYPALGQSYKMETVLGRGEAPPTFTGKPTVPKFVYVPKPVAAGGAP